MDQRRWPRYGAFSLLALVALLGMGCAHAISESLRAQAAPMIPFAQLRENPEAYKGRMVILGGEILQTTNLQEGTRLEILQKPLSHAGAPELTDTTGGRFMALCQDYLDPAIFAPGRRITIAGRVIGSHTGQVGEVEYRYPLISCEESHLWPRTVVAPPQYYHDPWYWSPYPYPSVFWRPYHLWPYYWYW